MSAVPFTARAFARERITITSGAVKQLTASVYNDTSESGSQPNQTGNNRRIARAAKIVLDSGSGDIHYSEEGTNPTTGVTGADVGSLAGQGDVVWLETYEQIVKFKSIALTATNGIAEVVYYR
jgi:hypothetical protein